MTKTNPFSAPSGFTLIEMMVAMVIFSIMALFLFSIVNSTATITSRTSSRLDANRVARECLDLIGKDLSQIALPYNTPDVNSGISASSPSLQMVLNPAGVNPAFQQPHSLFWQASISRNRTYGNLAIVGYYVLRDMPTGAPGKNRLQLRRLYVEPESPAITPAQYLIYSSSTGWFSNTLLGVFAPASTAADDDAGQKGWVADGVLAMWIRCLDPKGNPIVSDTASGALNYAYDSRSSYKYQVSGKSIYPYGRTFTSGTGSSYIPGPTLPAFVEASLVCTSPRDGRRIVSLPNAGSLALSSANFYNEVDSFTAAARNQNPQVKSIESFSRKFRIYAAP